MLYSARWSGLRVLPLIGWQHGAGDGRHWLERWARSTPPDLTICNSRFSENTLKPLAPDLRTEVVYCPVMPETTTLS